MSKKLLAMLLSMALCLSFAACGEKDDDDDDVKSSKSDNSKSASVDDSKDDKSEDDESKKDDAKDDESKKDEGTKDDVSKVDESMEDNSKAEEFVPEGKGEWAEGTGYKVFVGENWVNFDEYKTMIEEQIKETSKDQFNIESNLNMEICFYYNDGDFTDGAPCFNILKPQKNAAFKSVKLRDLQSTLDKQMTTQYQVIAGATVDCNGIVELGGLDALEYVSSATVSGTSLKARQYYVLNGEYMYTITFSIPADQYDGLKDDMDNILKSLKFTEA